MRTTCVGMTSIACVLLVACDTLPKSGYQPPHPGPRVAQVDAWASAARGPTSIGAVQTSTQRILFSGIRGNTQVYAMFVPESGSVAEFVLLDATLGSGPTATPAAVARLNKGYAYLIGRWPILITSAGTGTGIGTKIAAWINPDTAHPNHVRFFLIRPKPGQELRVQLAGSAPSNPPEVLATEGYIEVSDENNDGVGELVGTKERSDASGTVVWDADAESAYQFLLNQAAWYRLPFDAD